MMFINPTLDNLAMILGYVLLFVIAVLAMLVAGIWAMTLGARAIDKLDTRLFEFSNSQKGTRRSRLGYRITLAALAVTRHRSYQRYSKRELLRFLWRRRRHNALLKDTEKSHRCHANTCFLAPRDRARLARKRLQAAGTT